MNTVENLINKIKQAQKNGDYAESIKYCDELLEIDSSFIFINYEKAYSYFGLKDYDKTIKYAKICLNENLDNKEKALVYKLLGSAYFEKEDYENSIEYFDKNLELTPDDEIVKILKAESLFELENYDESLKIADELNDFELKANIYNAKNDFENAIKNYDILIYSSNNKLDILNFKENKAKALFQKGDYEGFVEICKETTAISPNKTLLFFMSVAYNRLGDEENARKYFLKANEYEPNLKKELFKMAEMNKDKLYDENSVSDNLKWGHPYFDIGLYDKALTYYLKAYELDDKNVEVLKSIGEAYFKLKDYEKCYEFFKKALEIDENNKSILFGAAFVCSLIGKPVELINYGNKILAEDDNFDIYPLIATAYVDLGKEESAIECIDQAINSHPETNYFHTAKGNLYYYLGEEENARKCFEKSIEINPYDPTPYCNQIVYYKDHNNQEKAKKIYERLIKNNPNFLLKFEDIEPNRL